MEQSEPKQKTWTRRRKKTKGQDGSFGKHVVKQPFSKKTLLEALAGKKAKTKPPLSYFSASFFLCNSAGSILSISEFFGEGAVVGLNILKVYVFLSTGQSHLVDLISGVRTEENSMNSVFCCFSWGKSTTLPKPRFSKPIFGHSAGSATLDRPHCKQFRF